MVAGGFSEAPIGSKEQSSFSFIFSASRKVFVRQSNVVGPAMYDCNSGPFFGDGELYVSQSRRVESSYSINNSKFEKMEPHMLIGGE